MIILSTFGFVSKTVQDSLRIYGILIVLHCLSNCVVVDDLE